MSDIIEPSSNNLESNAVLYSSLSESAGHCLHEPGSPGWKKYQAERRQRLIELKNERAEQARILQEKNRIQERVDYLTSLSTAKAKKPIIKKQSRIVSNKSVRFSKPEVLPTPKWSKDEFVYVTPGTMRDIITPAQPIKGKTLTPVEIFELELNRPTTSKSKSPISKKPLVVKAKPKPVLKPVTPKKKKSKVKGQGSSTTTISSVASNRPSSSTGKPKKKVKKIIKKKTTAESEEAARNKLIANLIETQLPAVVPRKSEPLHIALRKLPPIAPPRINFVPKTPHPGTKEWDEYWKGYHKALDKFDREMNEFAAGIKDYNEILEEYRKEAQRINEEERAFKIGLDKLGSAYALKPVRNPPPMRRLKITEAPTAFNGYVISSRRIEGTISNRLGVETGIELQVKIGTTDSDSLEVTRDNHFFNLSLGNKKQFLHICVPMGKSPNDVVIHGPIGGYMTIEGL